jgi:hypothetical protein
MDAIGEALARALLFSGREFTEAEQQRLEALCTLAVNELSARLRPEARAGEIHERFVSAAAALALSLYADLGDEMLTSVKIGAVTLRRGQGISLAARLRELAEEMLSGALRERGFAFKGVAG